MRYKATSSSTKTKQKQIFRKTLPRKLFQQESISCVTSALFGPIETKVLPSFEKDILLDRLSKEIIKKFHFSLRGTRRRKCSSYSSMQTSKAKGPSPNKNTAIYDVECDRKIAQKDKEKEEDYYRQYFAVIKSRIIVGTNECTRKLESALSSKKVSENKAKCDFQESLPSLILLTRDVSPPTTLAHIPSLAKLLQIPILLLPGRSSFEIGKLMGVKKISIVLFVGQASYVADNERLQNNEENHLSYKTRLCHRCIDSFVDFAKTKSPS